MHACPDVSARAALSGSLHTNVGDSTEVAVAVGSDMSVALGANYKIDGDSNVKSKVDKEVIICESVTCSCLILGAAAASGVGV